MTGEQLAKKALDIAKIFVGAVVVFFDCGNGSAHFGCLLHID